MMCWLQLSLLFFMVVLSACQSAAGRSLKPLVSGSAAANTTSLPASSATPIPTITPTSTPSPTPTSTLTPTLRPTPTPMPHPMDIQAARRADYPGSEIVLEKELERGANYRRYYASYLSEGLKIYALLTIPDGKAPAGGWPGIVFNHGYIPPAEYRTTERYIAYVDSLARSSYIVFRIDYRGHDRSEGTAGGAYSSPGYTIDVLNALASLQRFPQVNPQKIGMWGHSMGGFLTLRALVISPAIKCGVIWAGVVGSYYDIFYNWRHSTTNPTPPPGAGGWRGDWIGRYGTPEQNPAFWNSISANAFLADLSGLVQLHHGTADEEVPLEFSQMLSRQIQAAGGLVELYTYPGDNHNISNSFATAMQRTIQFFDRYLK